MDMSQAEPTASCWNAIGVSGDRSCPELTGVIHCRNCPVFIAAARTFLDRPPPEGYLAEWTRILDEPDPGIHPGTVGAASGIARDGLGVVLFRLRDEWLALRTQAVVEVTPVRPVHRIPHRTNHTLVGLTNLRGQLYLCVSLPGLLEIESTYNHGEAAGLTARMVIIRDRGDSWVFTADEVLRVPRVLPSLMRSVPSTLANPTVSFSQAIFSWEGRSVGLLDEGRVFAALRNLAS